MTNYTKGTILFFYDYYTVGHGMSHEDAITNIAYRFAMSRFEVRAFIGHDRYQFITPITPERSTTC